MAHRPKGRYPMDYEMMKVLYNKLSAAHIYLIGFVFENALYYVMMGWDELVTILKNDRAAASKGGMKKIRIKIKAADKKELVKKATKLGPAEMLETNDKYNYGHRFERIITEMFTSEKWVKDSIPFNVQGDIEINGEQIQIKFDNGELTNEKILTRLTANG